MASQRQQWGPIRFLGADLRLQNVYQGYAMLRGGMPGVTIVKKKRSGCTTGELYCSREVTVGKGYGLGLNEEETLRLLKKWCVVGPMPDKPRKDHMTIMRRRVQPRDLKTNQQLDELRRLWDPLGA